MDDNAEQQLTEKIKHCQETARNSENENKRLRFIVQNSTDTAGNSDDSVATPIANDVTKQLMDNDLALESKQQLKLSREKYLSTQSDLPTSQDGSAIQSDDNQMKVAKVTINQQVELSDDIKGQNEAKLIVNPTVQALFNGTLPDDFYLHLISVMGIQKCLISNRLVCSFWNELVLERCNNQKSLKLFENFNCLMKYGEWLLKYDKTDDTSLTLKSIGDDLLFEVLETDHYQLFDSYRSEVKLVREKKVEASKVLTSLFPRVEDLVLCTASGTCINVEHLLQFYAEQLTSLSLTESLFISWRHTSSILRAFNFPKLKSLITFNFSPEDAQLLSLLPQLESLTMKHTKISLETLLRTGTQLQELSLLKIESVNTAPVAEFSKRPPINANLRKFSFDSTESELQTLEFISLNLTALEYLKLDFELARNNLRPNPDNVSHLHLVTSYLVPLHQLYSLTIRAPISFFLLNNTQLAEIQPLPSVRQLKLILWNHSPLAMDLFSRALFAAFSKVEHILIGFVGNKDDAEQINGFKRNNGDGLVDTDILAAFEDFASKHPDVVQLARSWKMSKFTNLPNAVSPLLGNHRQVYEEYIEEEELFGVAICKLTACLVPRQGEDGPNLKSALRPSDRLTAMSNLLHLMESKAFTFTFQNVYAMLEHMVKCALKNGPSQVELFIVTGKCVLFLLDCSVPDEKFYPDVFPFLGTEGLEKYPFFKMIMNLLKHYKTQQFEDKNFLLQLYKRIVEFLEEFVEYYDTYQINELKILRILMKLADYYKTEQLSVLDNNEVLLEIYNLIDNQLQEFECGDRLNSVIRKLIHSEIRVYRVEMEGALTRCSNSRNNYDKYFKLLRGEVDNDSD